MIDFDIGVRIIYLYLNKGCTRYNMHLIHLNNREQFVIRDDCTESLHCLNYIQKQVYEFTKTRKMTMFYISVLITFLQLIGLILMNNNCKLTVMVLSKNI